MTSATPHAWLGQMLLDEGLITQEQLDAALAAQARAPEYVPLGRILVEQRAVTDRQLSLILERSGGRPRIGELLIRSGVLTPERLEHALVEQQRLQRPLGEVLVKMGFVTDEAMRQALGMQLNIPYVDLDRVEPDPVLARLINSNYARRHTLVPIARVGQMLTVCMDDPTSASVIAELAATTGLVINVVTAAEEAIKRAFQRLYGQAIGTPAQAFAAVREEPEEVAAAAQASEELFLSENAGRSDLLAEYAQGRNIEAAVRHLIALALNRRCSDIHIEMLSTSTHIRFRIDGVLQELDLGPLQELCDKAAVQIVSRIKILAKLDIAERRRPQDGSFRGRIERNGKAEYVDFRVSILPGYYGESCVVRVLDKSNAPKSIESLGFAPDISTRMTQLLKRPAGILLVAGPTGSGKSTTLYAALMTTYRPEIRVLTAEDPIEYVYEQFSQSEVNDRIGNTFARYLRAFLRHDPEVIMIGEIRDEETAEMAFRAAQTGHLLLSTVHANDAVSAVVRLLDLDVDPNLVASALLGVLSQRLIRRVCSDCRRPYEPAPELVREFFPARPEGLVFREGAGCKTCNFTGYRGRTCIAELWAPDAEDAISISKRAPMEQLRESASRTMVSMAQDMMDRIVAGDTTIEELIRVIPYSAIHEFRKLAAAGRLRALGAGAQAAASAGAGPSASAEPAAAGGAAPAPAAGGGHDGLFGVFSDIGRARALPEVLTLLAGHAASMADRVAVLIVSGSALRPFALRDEPGASLPAVEVTIVPGTVFAAAVDSGRPATTRDLPMGQGNPIADALAPRAGCYGTAFPVLQAGRTAAILYCERAETDGPAAVDPKLKSLEVLIRQASWRLDGLARSAGAAPAPAQG